MTSQIDYILCRKGNLREIRDCKVVAGREWSQAALAGSEQNNDEDQEREECEDKTENPVVET